MADDNTIIEGTVKFRDGKKWKSRWCVMRKLSPVADCVHLQLFRDSRARWGGAASKASLSLQQFVGCEAGFTLDKHSNTLALVCRDLVAVLAFETRERLIQWQVKVGAHLGEARQYLLLVGSAATAGANRRLPAGPARLHLHQARFALTAGVPPRLLGIWELAHLRRYGVVEGRFCFEGGSHCGKGEGLHVLITDQAEEITRDFELASLGRLSPRRRPLAARKTAGAGAGAGAVASAGSPHTHAHQADTYRADTRLSDLDSVERSLPPTELRLYGEACAGAEAGAVSPYWPSAERTHLQDMGHGDTASVNEATEGDSAPWGAVGGVSLERCMSCISKLGALSRSSTGALTPGAKHFNPAWTMEAVQEIARDVPCDTIAKTEDTCRCDRPPDRPPKPNRLELKLNRKAAMSLPARACGPAAEEGPYRNYDVPRLPSAEVDGEYYDTPKRLKEGLDEELFKVTKCSDANAVILKKPCGCLLRVGRRRPQPTVVDAEEAFRPANCPCQRVTDWANNWIKLPYCRKGGRLSPNKENVQPSSSELYATIDLSRKTRRKSRVDNDDDRSLRKVDPRTVEVDEGPLANYENLNFALSLEHYENAKDLLRRAGVTQAELDAIGDNLKPVSFGAAVGGGGVCTKCRRAESSRAAQDDYLMMAPNSVDGSKSEHDKALPAGYTPMSPIGGFVFHTLKHDARSPINRLLEEKSASNPTLCCPDSARSSGHAAGDTPEERPSRTVGDRAQRIEYRKRSSSADSSRFLEDVKEFEGSVGSRGSASSIETLRNMALGGAGTPTPCACAVDSSEASKGRGSSQNQSKRVTGVPAKAGGNRDSSSSNDSGVSSCSLRPGADLTDFELPLTTAATRRHYRSARRAAAGFHASLPRRSKSTDPLRDFSSLQRARVPAKSSSAEAEVPVLSAKPLRGVADTHSTSSGTSDMSDYIETLSICSSHSSADTPVALRVVRQTTSTLRPRSGNEYQNVDARLAGACRAAPAALAALAAGGRGPHHCAKLPSHP